jgi:hypothetical protein
MYESPNPGHFPGKLQAISIIQTVTGALQIVASVFLAIYVFVVGIATFGIGWLLFPIPVIYLIVGTLSLISGIKWLQQNPVYGLGFGVAITQLFGIFLCDFISFGAGLASLILLTQTEVKAFFGR